MTIVQRLGGPMAKRVVGFFLLDAAAMAAAIVVAFLLRFEGEIPDEYQPRLAAMIVLSIVIKSPVIWRFGLYRMRWRYASFNELVDTAKAVSLGSLLYSSVLLIGLRGTSLGVGLPRSVLILDFLLTALLVGMNRAGKRIYLQFVPQARTGRRRLLIVGAGSAAEMLLRELRRKRALNYHIVGLIDDDPAKRGLRVHGATVLGRRDDILRLVQSKAVDEIIIAMPSAPVRAISEIASLSKRTGAVVKILPAIYGALAGDVKLGYLREINIEDLLPRPPVHIDMVAVEPLIRDESVLVTGAGGSIGSELSRQVTGLKPRRLVLLGNAENDIFAIESELQELRAATEVIPVIADVRSADKIERVFREFRPSLVFHAAAHKHVALMEVNADEAVSNNVFGTKTIAEACDRHGVKRMVFISSDKAVNPVSVMGASKRWAELVVQSLAARSATRFIIVRFGNVLNSTGSVVPIFRRQIERGGPVTVTDPAMTRFFMTIPEAVHLIIQAAVMGKGGEVFVLDMGKPVRISDLAENLIRLAGLEPHRDIEIRVIGSRPGEKMHEETFFDDERMDKTAHPHIFVVTQVLSPDTTKIDEELPALQRYVSAMDQAAIRKKLLELIAAAD